jgi:hypothetical protein
MPTLDETLCLRRYPIVPAPCLRGGQRRPARTTRAQGNAGLGVIGVVNQHHQTGLLSLDVEAKCQIYAARRWRRSPRRIDRAICP